MNKKIILFVCLLFFSTTTFALLDFGDDIFILKRTTNITSGRISGFFNSEFTDSNLSASVLTVDHNLSASFPLVTIYDNNNQILLPDDVTFIDVNQVTVDLSSFTPLVGTWNVSVVGGTGLRAVERLFTGLSPIVVNNDNNTIGLSVTLTTDWNGLFRGEDGNFYQELSNAIFDDNSVLDERYVKLDPSAVQTISGFGLTLSGSNAQLVGSQNGDLNFQDGTFTRNLTVDTDTLCVIASNNRLGVNTCVPNHTLDVQGGDATVIRMLRTTNVVSSGAGITFDLLNSVGAAVPYARMQGLILTNTAGDQNGEYFFDVAEAGVFVQKLRLSPGSTVFNDAQRDVDFTIKTNSINHFVINGALERTTIQGGSEGSSTMFIVRNFSANNLLLVSNTQVVVNQDSISTLNFRVESDDFTQAFLIDSATNTAHFDVNVDIDPGIGTGSVIIDGSNGGCLIIRDTDDAGFTYCTTLNGILTCSMTAC